MHIVAQARCETAQILSNIGTRLLAKVRSAQTERQQASYAQAKWEIAFELRQHSQQCALCQALAEELAVAA